MKTNHSSLLIRLRSAGLAALCLLAAATRADDQPLLLENEVQATLRDMRGGGNHSEQLRRARLILTTNTWISSAQVKTLARGISDDDARIAFAVAAFPRTVDPENFYEVYDAFTRFSKAFRLHDRIQALRAGLPDGAQPVLVVATAALPPEELAEITKTLRAEPFEDTRQQLARQILTARVRFNSSQVRDVLKLFNFDEARLALAKAAHAYVVDPENYFVVTQAFTFSSNKEELTRYVESRQKRPSH